MIHWLRYGAAESLVVIHIERRGSAPGKIEYSAQPLDIGQTADYVMDYPAHLLLRELSKQRAGSISNGMRNLGDTGRLS